MGINKEDVKHIRSITGKTYSESYDLLSNHNGNLNNALASIQNSMKPKLQTNVVKEQKISNIKSTVNKEDVKHIRSITGKTYSESYDLLSNHNGNLNDALASIQNSMKSKLQTNVVKEQKISNIKSTVNKEDVKHIRSITGKTYSESYDLLSNHNGNLNDALASIQNSMKSKTQQSGINYSNIGNSNIYADNIVMNGTRGHGFAAEKANHIHDKMAGKNASIIGGDNAKNGADRLVNGTQIQTKYCSSGSKSIGECFEGGKLRYRNADGTPMKIEVPSDQYEAAVKAMQERIKKGQVPGVSDPMEAKDIVKKGSITYKQARNIAKFGNIDSLSYDAMNGVKVAGTAMGISSVLTFASAIWNGENINVALEQAVYSGLKVGGISWVTSIATAQIGRTGIEKSLRPATDYLVKKMGPKATSTIANSLRSGSNIYGAAAANNVSKLLRGNIVTNVVVTTVLSAADITRLVSGNISGGQAFKNVATTAASVVGGATGYVAGASMGTAAGGTVGGTIGGIIGSIVPGAGTIAGAALGAKIGAVVGGLGTSVAGGTVAGKVTKSALDNFIEDDAKAMMKILEKQFEVVAFDFLLTQREIEKVSNKLGESNLPKELRNMYGSSNRKDYAYNLIEGIAINVVKSRPRVTIPSDEKLLETIGRVIEKAS